MTATNAITAVVQAGYSDTVERTRAALAEQGFGILTEIDVAATMKAKLDIDMAPHLILGACNPPLAHRALAIQPSLGLLLPCNVVVRAVDHAHTLVEAIDPDMMVAVTDQAELTPIADEARQRLADALATLTSSGDQP